MTKDEFLKILLLEGFYCEKSGQYPSVVCDAKDVKKTATKVRSIAKEKGYDFSLAIRSYREGMELISKDGAVDFKKLEAETDDALMEQSVSISEPIPMTSIAEGVSA